MGAKFVNQKKKATMTTWNKFLPLNTVWRYAPSVHDGVIGDTRNDWPDRKVFVMTFAAAITGQFKDNDMLMPGFEDLGLDPGAHGAKVVFKRAQRASRLSCL